MELMDKQIMTPTRAWISRVEKRYPTKIDYSSALRSWMQHAILKAEEKKDFNKKVSSYSPLKDLQNRPRFVFTTEMTRRKE